MKLNTILPFAMLFLGTWKQRRQRSCSKVDLSLLKMKKCSGKSSKAESSVKQRPLLTFPDSSKWSWAAILGDITGYMLGGNRGNHGSDKSTKGEKKCLVPIDFIAENKSKASGQDNSELRSSSFLLVPRAACVRF